MLWIKGIFSVLTVGSLALVWTCKGIGAVRMRFTNVQCEALDKPFADFQECRLHVLGRGIIALNIHVNLFKVPVTNVSVNLELLKRESGYRPFLYNITTDFCMYMKRRKSVPFFNIFYNIFAKDSNVNHTCPYAHDIIIKNLVLKEEHLRLLPLPSGHYIFRLGVAAYNDWKAIVHAYMSRSE